MDDAEKRAIDAVRVYLRFVESKRDVPGAVICDFVQHRNAALAALLKEYDAATPPPADDEAGRLRELLRRMVERYAPHSSSCGRFDESGKVVITEASCQCDLLAKEARAALAHRPGDTQAADEAGRLRAALLVYRTAQRRMLERWADGDAAVRQELWRDLHACEEVADEALAHRPGGGLAGRDAT